MYACIEELESTIRISKRSVLKWKTNLITDIM
jgi:hypothetical protein